MRVIILLALALGFCAAFAAAQLGYDNCLGCHDPVGPAIVETPHAKANGVLCSDCHGEHAGNPAAENIRSLEAVPATGSLQNLHPLPTPPSTPTSPTHAKTDRGLPELPRHVARGGDDGGPADAGEPAGPEGFGGFVPALPQQGPRGGQQALPPSAEPDRQPVRQLPRSAQERPEIRTKAIDRKCAACHPETGGPFMYVHLSGQYRGCVECHNPHGSPYPNLSTAARCGSCACPATPTRRRSWTWPIPGISTAPPATRGSTAPTSATSSSTRRCFAAAWPLHRQIDADCRTAYEQHRNGGSPLGPKLVGQPGGRGGPGREAMYSSMVPLPWKPCRTWTCRSSDDLLWKQPDSSIESSGARSESSSPLRAPWKTRERGFMPGLAALSPWSVNGRPCGLPACDTASSAAGARCHSTNRFLECRSSFQLSQAARR